MRLLSLPLFVSLTAIAVPATPVALAPSNEILGFTPASSRVEQEWEAKFRGLPDRARMRADMLDVFGRDGVIEQTGPALGIAFSDLLLHGWDLARATHQDPTMPDGLAQAAYDTIYGKFSDEQRGGMFKPEIPIGADASPQQKLLAYTGRDPG